MGDAPIDPPEVEPDDWAWLEHLGSPQPVVGEGPPYPGIQGIHNTNISNSTASSNPSFFNVEVPVRPVEALVAVTQGAGGPLPPLWEGDSVSSDPSFFRLAVSGSEDDPQAPTSRNNSPFDWGGILGGLSQAALDAVNALATSLALAGLDEVPAPDVPPLFVASEQPPDQNSDDNSEPPDDRSDAGSAGDREEDPEEADDSALGFLSQPGGGRITPDHHPDFQPPPVLRIPATDHRVQSILTAGAKSFIPPAGRGLNHPTFSSRINSELVANLVEARLLEPGTVSSSFRLFASPKADGRVRALYDLSPLTPHLSRPSCSLPRAIDLLSRPDALYAVKIDLRDGFFHIPLHPALRPFMGVSYQGRTYRWTALPMGLATAPSIMQTVMKHVAALACERLPGIHAYVYLDDFLFVAPSAELLAGVAPLLTEWGLRINHAKSVLTPTHTLTYLGIKVDLLEKRLSITDKLRDRVLQAISDVPNKSLLYAQRLAGFVNFVRPISRLPLQLISEILRRNPSLPDSISRDMFSHTWDFDATDYSDRFCEHTKWIATDATPTQIGLADPSGTVSIKLPVELPIYEAELLGALCALFIAPATCTIYVDNVAALVNAHKGRCPSQWLPWVTRIFRDRAASLRYVPTQYNPADRPSRLPW